MTTTISNPPYNLKWEVPILANMESRFYNAGVPPQQNANYAFVLTALNESDRSIFILPNSVLQSSNKQEQEIVKYLCESNLIDSVILCPNNMFENTKIATCIMIFDKNKQDNSVLMIDLREKYEIKTREQKGQYGNNSHTNRVYKKNVNILSDDVIDQVVDCINQRKTSDLCQAIDIDEIRKNNYCLSPARYEKNDLYKEKNHREYDDVIDDINRVILEKNACKLTINETLAKKLGFDLSLYAKCDFKEVNDMLEKLGNKKIIREDYFQTSKRKNEVKFENNNKDNISSIFMMIFQMWKQHIYYLNNEENRYLAELRDALLPELMTGKIKLDWNDEE